MNGAITILLSLSLALALTGCSDDDPDHPTPPVVLTHELTSQWRSLPHRISDLELTLQAADDPQSGVVIAQNDGGSFGIVDAPEARYGMQIWRSDQLVSAPGSVTIAIEPQSEVAGEPFSAAATADLPAGDLSGATALLAIIRGYHITTSAYPSPPPFQTDPDLPYDPADGFTTQGLGIALSTPALVGDRVELEVRVRNSLGLSDRGDMNAAIPQATTWVQVDFTVIGALGANAVISSGSTDYTLSFADYGQNTVHEHAAPQAQQVDIQGNAGAAHALFGLSSFDIWLNVEEHKDPSCEIVQDPVNSWDEEISGPGRYVRELAVRLWDASYSPQSGAGAAKVDLMLSNSSEFKEVGNVCLGLRGEVGMLQLDDPSASSVTPQTAVLELTSGERASAAVSFEP